MRTIHNMKVLLISILYIFLMSIASLSMGETITATSHGNWNDRETWDIRIPTVNDDVFICGQMIIVNSEQYCRSIWITADTISDTKLSVVDGDLHIKHHLTVEVDNQNKHTDVEIKGRACINVGGYVVFERSIKNNQKARMQLHITEYGQMNVQDDFEFSYGAAHKKENNQEIWLEGHAQLNVQGSLTFEQIKHGRDAELLITDNALLTVDGHMFIAHFVGERVKVQLRDQSIVNVRGSLAFYHGYFMTNDFSYIDMFDGSALCVAGDFEIYPRGSKTIMYIRLHQSSAFHIRGRLIVHKAGWDNLKIQLNDYSSVSIGGLGLKENTLASLKAFNVTGGRCNISIVGKKLVATPRHKSAALMQ